MRQEALIDFLIEALLPKEEEVQIRNYPVSVFLPEGDLDLVLLSPIGEGGNNDTYGMKLILHLLQSLCTHAVSADAAGSFARPGGLSYSIKNVEFVNARTKLVHCVVNTIGVDITVNQVGAVIAASFLEDVDQLVGHNHLFKRSLLLIKCWCYHESIKYAGVSILGSKYGFFSSYAIAVLLIHLFNKYHFTSFTQSGSKCMDSGCDDYCGVAQENRFPTNVHIDGVAGNCSGNGSHCTDEFSPESGSKPGVSPHPFSYLLKFLEDFSKISWSNSVVTVTQGVVPIQYGSTPVSPEATVAVTNHFAALVEKYQGMSNAYNDARLRASGAPSPVTSATFILRLCNIQDPLDFNNNLGLAVTTTTVQLIDHALKSGCYHLQQLMIAESNLAQQRHNRKNQYFKSFPHTAAGGDVSGHGEGINRTTGYNEAGVGEPWRRTDDGSRDGSPDRATPSLDTRSSETVSGKRCPSIDESDDERSKGTDEDEVVVDSVRERSASISAVAESHHHDHDHQHQHPRALPHELMSSPQLPPTHSRPGHATKPNRSRAMSGSTYPNGSGGGGSKLPSLLEEFFPRSCITYFQSYFKLPDHHRPTLTQYLRRMKQQTSFVKPSDFDVDTSLDSCSEKAGLPLTLNSSSSAVPNICSTTANAFSSCDGQVDELKEFLTYMASVSTGEFVAVSNGRVGIGPTAGEIAAVTVPTERVTTAVGEIAPVLPSVRASVSVPLVPDSFLSVAKSASNLIQVTAPSPPPKEMRSLAHVAVTKSASKSTRSKIKEPNIVRSLDSGGEIDDKATLTAVSSSSSQAKIGAVKASVTIQVHTVDMGMQTEETETEATAATSEVNEKSKVAVDNASLIPVTPVRAKMTASTTEFSPATMNIISAEEGRPLGPVAVSITSMGTANSSDTVGKSGGRRRNSASNKQQASRGTISSGKVISSSSGDQTNSCSKLMSKFLGYFGFVSPSGSISGIDNTTVVKGNINVGTAVLILALLILLITCLLNIPILYATLNAVPDYAWGMLPPSGNIDPGSGSSESVAETGSNVVSQKYNSSYISQLFAPTSVEPDATRSNLLEFDSDCFGLGQCKRKKKADSLLEPLVETSSRVPMRRQKDLDVDIDVGLEPLNRLSGQIDWFPMATHYLNSGSVATLSPDDDLLKYLLETALSHQSQARDGRQGTSGREESGGDGINEPNYDGYKKGRGAGRQQAADEFGGGSRMPDEDLGLDSFPHQDSASKVKHSKFRKTVVVNDLFTFRWVKLEPDQTEQGSGVGKTTGAAAELLAESSSFLYHIPVVSPSDTGIYVCYAIPLSSTRAGPGVGMERVMIAKSKIIVSTPPLCSSHPPMWVSLQLGKEIVIELDDCSGTPIPSYQWYKNGVKLINETRNTYYEEFATSASAGTYSCVLQNMAGIFNWMEATIDLSHH